MLSSLSVVLVVSTAVVNAVNLDLNRVTAERSAQIVGAAHHDRARATFLRTRDSSEASNVPATQFGYSTYTVSVGIGDPPTYYDLIADTGSSNTWVGAGKSYLPTSTSIRTNETVEVTYGTGSFFGDEYYDQVTLAPDFVVHNQSIGGAYNSSDFAGVDGIIGLGPVDLTIDTLSPDNSMPIPTVLDNALAQGIVQQEVIGVSFVPATTANDTDGVITFGSLDSSLYIGEIQYIPTTETFPASAYWGINITYATIGREPLIPGSFAGIVDTGTTLILLADDWFQTYLDTIPGAYVDVNSTGLLIIPKSSVSYLQSINLLMGNSLFTITPAAQLIPQFQNEANGGDPSVQYGVVGPSGAIAGAGLDFILGQKFLERYYAVFDGANQRVGFGFTKYTLSPVES